MTYSSILYLVLVIASTGFSQTLLKLGANQAHEKKLVFAYVNPYTLIAYSLYVLATLFLQCMPLKTLH